MTPAPDSTGLLLLRGDTAAAESYVARSVVPLWTAPARPWTLAAQAGVTTVGEPYDDATLLLAARRVPDKAAPAIGVFQWGERALITLHLPGRRSRPGWVVWEREIGLLRPPGLPLAGPAELTRAAGAPPTARDGLVDLLHQTRPKPRTMLQAVLDTLELPGGSVLADPRTAADLPGARRHEPSAKEVALFEDAVADTVALRRELGALR